VWTTVTCSTLLHYTQQPGGTHGNYTLITIAPTYTSTFFVNMLKLLVKLNTDDR